MPRRKVPKSPQWKRRIKWETRLAGPQPPKLTVTHTAPSTLEALFQATKAGETPYMWAPHREAEHGAWVPYVIEPMAASILEWVMERVKEPGSPIAFLSEPQFQPLLDRWARSEARRMRFEGVIASMGGEVDGDGRVNKYMDQLVVWEKRSTYHAERAGLDPLALAKIRRELAELHKEEEAVHALVEMQAKYARRSKPEVIDSETG